jgi:hypothetical protein
MVSSRCQKLNQQDEENEDGRRRAIRKRNAARQNVGKIRNELRALRKQRGDVARGIAAVTIAGVVIPILRAPAGAGRIAANQGVRLLENRISRKKSELDVAKQRRIRHKNSVAWHDGNAVKIDNEMRQLNCVQTNRPPRR